MLPQAGTAASRMAGCALMPRSSRSSATPWVSYAVSPATMAKGKEHFQTRGGGRTRAASAPAGRQGSHRPSRHLARADRPPPCAPADQYPRAGPTPRADAAPTQWASHRLRSAVGRLPRSRPACPPVQHVGPLWGPRPARGGREELRRRPLVTTGLVDELPDVAGLHERWGEGRPALRLLTRPGGPRPADRGSGDRSESVQQAMLFGQLGPAVRRCLNAQLREDDK
jgi:hypothetical protein